MNAPRRYRALPPGCEDLSRWVSSVNAARSAVLLHPAQPVEMTFRPVDPARPASPMRSAAMSERKRRAAPGGAVVVGRDGDVPRALEHPAVVGHRGLTVAGVITVDGTELEDHSARGVELDELLRESGAASVLVAGPVGRDTMRVITDIAMLNGCRVLAVMPSEVVAGHNPVVVWQGERPLVQLLHVRPSAVQALLKRALDVAGALAGLAVLAPIFLIFAALLRLDSAGPIIFRHRRMGRGGRAFDCLKFRTMVEDAEAQLASDPSLRSLYHANNFRVPDAVDPRVTRLGRILRRCSLDELPQLWNVLVGEMSLIGPRPVVQDELQHFAGSERLLLSMRPGMTGMWAVSGRHECGYPARAELELSYVRSWSLWADAGIALRTLGAIARYGSTAAD